jgi:glycosyltransferase involved in cell wall biosynthesis
MHIAMNGWFWDNPTVGSGQYLQYLLPALLALDSNLKITLVSPRPLVGNRGGPVSFELAQTPFRDHKSHLAKVWFEQIAFPRTCQRLRAEVAHVPYFGSPLAPTVPTVVTIHDLIPMVLPEYRGGWRTRLYTSLVAAAASQTTMILTDSRASQRDIMERLGLPGERIRVVYLAAPPHFKPPDTWDEIATVLKKYRLPNSYVLYLGGYDVRKNLAALLHAFTWVVKTLGQEYPLVLAGRLPQKDTPFFPSPLRMARELGLEDYILTPGWIEEADLPPLYAGATVFVYPSYYEGFGLPVLEAMACGTAVVTTNAASLPEIAGPAAYQPDPFDTKHLAAPIIRLCANEGARDEMIARGLEQAQKFSWTKTAQETLRVYQEVAR